MRARNVSLLLLVAGLSVVTGTPSARGSDVAGEAPRIDVQSVKALAVDPSSPDILYAGTESGLFKSQDRGAHWSATPLTYWTTAVAVDPSRMGTVYASTFQGFFRSLDGGGSWSLIRGLLDGAFVRSLAVDRTRSIVYAGAGVNQSLAGLFRSVDQGTTWQPTGLTGLLIATITIDPTNPQVLYAAPYATIPSANAGRGIVKSSDGGATWSSPGTPVGGGPPFSSIVVDPANPANVYASWFFGMLWKSADAGATWTKITLDPQAVNQQSTVLAIDPSNPAILYLATGRGLFKSVDGAMTWQPLPNSPQVAVSALVLDHERLFVGIDPFGPWPFQFFRSEDGGATWAGASLAAQAACVAGGQNLCLSDGRFDVRVRWTAPPSYPGQRMANAIPIGAQTGAFWFFSSDNLEVVVKVVDGRAFNGSFWVFYGALSNVEYEVVVTDTSTGAIRTYFNPAGRLASVADTSAF